jgi:hypothetical protein
MPHAMATGKKSANSTSPQPILKIDSHRGLADAQQEIANRLEANQAIAQLLLINPVSAFKDVGVEVSPAIATHILHTLQGSSESAAERKRLTAAIKTGKAGTPKPLDPKWVAKFLFEELKLKPLEADGATPVYLPTIDPAKNAAFVATLPQLNTSAPLPHPDHGTTFDYSTIPAGVRHLDLNSPAPVLPVATKPPDEVDLTTLYFYKDLDPRANDLLQLGILETQTFQISSADTYRKVKSGEIPNPWGDWISSITFTP